LPSDVSLELQAAFTSGFGKCLDLPVKEETTTIKVTFFNPGLFSALRNRGTDLAGCLDIVLAREDADTIVTPFTSSIN
jgi:hypothetical protein